MKHTDYQDDDEDFISKSELKREAHRHQQLGKKLADLNPKKWRDLPISENLYNALVENNRLSQNEAKRRHLQFIGKIMRDEDVDAILAGLELLDPSSEAYGRRIKQQEMWRNRLVSDDSGLNAFIEEFPAVDRQQLRNLVRNAQKEMSSEPPKPGTNYKKLFQFIREQMEG